MIFAKVRFLALFCFLLFFNPLQSKDFNGFFDYTYNEASGKVTLKIKKFDQEFLLVNYYGSGLGSNDIGFDRGKIAKQRLVQFKRYGNRIALVESNTFYRAITDNVKEKKAAEDAFASSILFAFVAEQDLNGSVQIDLTPFLTEDLNNTAQSLKDQKQGNYKVDKFKSIIIPDEMHAFPKNIEFESWMTFIGESTGNYLKAVTPTEEIISLRQHTSFVMLPEDGYKPRTFHPQSGYFAMSYFDYASPIYEPIEKRLILRHRLEKKNPALAKSEAVEPIVYYVDPGCPEPIKAALIEGASWWNQAYEEAGFINAFQVKELPEGAHPLDVRYNTIQWVHRSTRGWSYGSTISDPRTGEIIKGHVTLGSLRVRQDFMIAQGLLSIYEGNKKDHGPMTAMALARLRQLSAHEVGHTIGLAHNFAASYNDRASVMDYPHPLAEINANGNIDFTNAYDNKIALWDKRAIIYGYKIFDGSEEQQLQNIINENKKMGLKFLSDPDARPDGSAAADAHLWDNGKDPVAELERVLKIRNIGLQKFGLNTIPDGTPLSELEKILVPLYHAHRYQLEASSKLIGGSYYEYMVKGDDVQQPYRNVELKDQMKALETILSSISPKNLIVSEEIKKLLLPNAYGYEFSRESFKNETGYGFDQIAAATSSIDHVLNLLMHPQRLARIDNQGLMSLTEYFNTILDLTSNHSITSIDQMKISAISQRNFLHKLIQLSQNNAKAQTASAANATIKAFKSKTENTLMKTKNMNSFLKDHYQYMIDLMTKLDKHEPIELPQSYNLPPGAPIGCE